MQNFHKRIHIYILKNTLEIDKTVTSLNPFVIVTLNGLYSRSFQEVM